MTSKKLLLTLIGVSILYALTEGSTIPHIRTVYNLGCLFLSMYFYHHESPKPYCPRNILYLTSLLLGMIGCILTSLRNLDMMPNYEMIVFSMMQVCFILGIKKEKKYLFLGRKKTLLLGIVIIFISLLLFSKFLLPYIKNTSFPISVFFVFILGFSFLVAINRKINENDSDYILILAGVCCMIISSTIASVSQFIVNFNYAELLEDISFQVGVVCNTLGMVISKVDRTQKREMKTEYW